VRYNSDYLVITSFELKGDTTVSQQTQDPKYNLAIIGSRSFHDYVYAKVQILNIVQANHIAITGIISGGAGGADKIAETFASMHNIPIKILKPDWNVGKHAGILRNTKIIEECNCVIAFWDGKSKGTLDSITKAKRMNKSLFVIDVSQAGIQEGTHL